MRTRQVPIPRRLMSGGLWLLVLFALPNCTLDRSGIVSLQNLDRGAFPWQGAVFCQIEKPLRRCASTLTDEERASAIRIAEAAIALVEGRSSTIGIDDSLDAIVRCGPGGEAVLFEGPFPEGLPVCLNCDSIGPTAPNPSPLAVCQRRCYDFYGVVDGEGSYGPDIPPHPEVQAFCDSRANVAVNMPDSCLAGVCDGGLRDDFVDPRRAFEGVGWTDHIGSTSSGDGSDLVRSAPATGAYDAGAVSLQWITRGDAFAEFGVTGDQRIGLTEIPAACPSPCADTDPGVGAIGFAIEANADGRIYVYERGVKVEGPDINGSFGTFSNGERFRIALRDNGDDTATVAYQRVVSTCLPGAPCLTTVLSTSTGRPRYPFRVDASLKDPAKPVVSLRYARVK